MGAHLKSTVALSVGSEVFVSQHIGDLETVEAGDAYRRATADLPRLYSRDPESLACDAHPDYLSTRLALASGLPVAQVQHHHAHVAACLAENGDDGPALGVSWDGTGYGEDGTVWGGEILRADAKSCERFAHLRTFTLPGGDAAAHEPRRSALGLLHAMWGDAIFDREDLALLRAFSTEEKRLMRGMLSRGLNCPVTSSMGRLFDAVASIVNRRQRMRFEGQAAMELEFAATRASLPDAYPFRVVAGPPGGAAWILDWEPLVEALLAESSRGEEVSHMAARFHNTLVEMIVETARLSGETKVILTGGCFQNGVLTARAVLRLREEGFTPLRHRAVPPNDGGVAVGQIVVAAARRHSLNQ
jgi:hydrogenase maturation protein HypF